MNNNIKKLMISTVMLTISFTVSAQLATIPLEMSGGHIFIRVSVGENDSLRFVFDTGATNASIDSAAAVKSGMDMTRKQLVQAGGHNSTENYTMVLGQTLKIGGLEVNNVNPLVDNFKGMTDATGMKLDGLIGYELMNTYVTGVDFGKKQMSFYASISEADTAGYTAIPFEFSKGILIPRIPVTIKLETGELFTGRSMVDSGGAFTLLVSTPFNKFHQLSDKLPNKTVKHSRGISALTNEERALIAGMSFGDFELGKMAIELTINDKAEPKDGYLGMIGIDIIEKFDLIFDYPNKKIYMKPNSKYKTPFAIN